MESPFVYNPQLVFINLFLFIILTINIRKIWNYRIKRNSKSQKGYLFLFIFASLYSVFNFSEGDFYSYADLFYWGNRTNDFEYLESPYQYIVYNITNNYLLWRFVVWGGALLLYILTFKRMKLNPSVAITIFVVSYLYQFSISRESLGLAMLFYGISFLAVPSHKKYRSYLYGGVIIALSYYFHRTMLISIGGIAFMLFKVNKNNLFKIGTVFVVFVMVANVVISYFSNGGTVGFVDDLTSAKIGSYATGSKVVFNAWGIVMETLRMGGSLFGIILIVKKMILKNEYIPTYISMFLSYWFGMAFLSFSLYFLDGSDFISQRVLIKSMPAAVIVLSYYFSNYRADKFAKLSLVLYMSYPLYKYFYYLYAGLIK